MTQYEYVDMANFEILGNILTWIWQ